MNQPLRLFLTTLLALTIAFAFNFFFLNLSERPFIDQILLVAFSTAALGYLIFSLWGTALNLENSPSIKKIKFNRTSIQSFFREHVPGIVLALLFFAIYTFIGLQLNNLSVDTTDNFLDADNSSWMTRISAPDGSSLEMRGPHPFAYFIFRPLGWFLNLFTQNPPRSAILLTTFTGALCVFMAWVFIKREFQDSTYALLVASLLGLSTAHIFFGSVIETYIFSAAALIGFILVIQKRTDSMLVPVTVSLVTFGITLTNFVQNFIVFLVTSHLKNVSLSDSEGSLLPKVRDSSVAKGAPSERHGIFEMSSSQTLKISQKNFRVSIIEVFRFTAFTISLGILISLIHAAWFPSSRLFFLLSDAQVEEEFAFSLFQEPTWRAVGRVFLLIRTVLLYTVIAPRPFVFGREVGGTFPRFNFFKIAPETFSYSSYDGSGNILVLFWAGLLLISGFFFLRNLIRTRKTDLSFAFVLSILFNFILHLNYGYEPFLYSPDWAYALIFFVAFSLAPLAKNRLFQGGILAFLILLAYNQFQFFNFIFGTISLFFDKGA